MSLYNNILVAYDGSEKSQQALKRAIELVQQMNEACSLHLVKVWSRPILHDSYAMYSYSRLIEDLEKDAQSTLAEAEKLTEDIGDRRTGVVLEGHPAEQIVEYANQNEIDLIVIGNRGLGGIKKIFLGSVSQRVVQEATCEVLIVK